jgi:hypothetical protein
VLVLADREVVVGNNEMVCISEVQLSSSVLEVDVGVGSSLCSGVPEVDIVPSSQVLLVRNSLPLILVSVAI